VMYAEGGRYIHEDGQWALQLTVSHGSTVETLPTTIETS